MIKLAKPHPEKVSLEIGKIAVQRAVGDKQKAWSEYIRAMYQSTGSLAPRCDAKDFYEWFNKNIITSTCGFMMVKQPEIAIVIEGGCVSAIATAGQGITVRVIDLDNKKIGEPDIVKDYTPDVENMDIAQYTKEIMED